MRKPQRQDSVTDQMHDLLRIAVDEGMYDAADWIQDRWNFGKYRWLEFFKPHRALRDEARAASERKKKKGKS